MKETKINAMLHPIRMQILQTLIGGRKLTVQQISQRMPEVAQATLYRHLKTLFDIELIVVAEENKVRGTLERVYALNESKAVMKAEDITNLTREEHFNMFFKFLLNQLADFDSYLSQEKIDFLADGIGYHQANLYLDDNELIEFYKSIGETVMKASKNEPSKERKLRVFSTIMIPKKK